MFKNRIKLLRKEYDLTQKQLANILKITDVALSNYELGKRMPDTEMVQKIADYFNVSVDYLLARTDIRNPYGDEETTIAAHRTTTLDEDLPPEAQKAIEEFRHYIREKYGKKNTK